MKPLFSLRFTVLLGAFLFVPFVLRILHPKLEPYPGILLPSGAGKINLERNIVEVNMINLYGYDRRGNLQKIDKQHFLEPIPKHFLSKLARNEFGLSDNQVDDLWLNFVGRKIVINKRKMSPEDREDAKDWLSTRLNNLNLSSKSFVVRYEQQNIDISNRKIISIHIKDEKHIKLR